MEITRDAHCRHSAPSVGATGTPTTWRARISKPDNFAEEVDVIRRYQYDNPATLVYPRARLHGAQTTTCQVTAPKIGAVRLGVSGT